jgi:hypothetical protein
MKVSFILSIFSRRSKERVLAKGSNQGRKFLIKSDKSSMYLLALEVSPYKSFYEEMGGRVVGTRQIDIEGVMYDEPVYGWGNLR